MESLLKMVSQQLGGDNLKKISSQIGADENTTQGAVSAALPLLLNALSRDHDGSILDNLSGFLGQSNDTAGAGILGHILGSRQGAVQNGLSKSSGMNAGSVGKLLGTLAPVLMGALGKVKQQGNMDAGSLAGYLGREREEMERSEPQAMGFIGNLLDSDGDGDVDASDLIKHGMRLFSKFMK